MHVGDVDVGVFSTILSGDGDRLRTLCTPLYTGGDGAPSGDGVLPGDGLPLDERNPLNDRCNEYVVPLSGNFGVLLLLCEDGGGDFTDPFGVPPLACDRNSKRETLLRKLAPSSLSRYCSFVLELDSGRCGPPLNRSPLLMPLCAFSTPVNRKCRQT